MATLMARNRDPPAPECCGGGVMILMCIVPCRTRMNREQGGVS